MRVYGFLVFGGGGNICTCMYCMYNTYIQIRCIKGSEYHCPTRLITPLNSNTDMKIRGKKNSRREGDTHAHTENRGGFRGTTVGEIHTWRI